MMIGVVCGGVLLFVCLVLICLRHLRKKRGKKQGRADRRQSEEPAYPTAIDNEPRAKPDEEVQQPQAEASPDAIGQASVQLEVEQPRATPTPDAIEEVSVQLEVEQPRATPTPDAIEEASVQVQMEEPQADPTPDAIEEASVQLEVEQRPAEEPHGAPQTILPATSAPADALQPESHMEEPLKDGQRHASTSADEPPPPPPLPVGQPSVEDALAAGTGPSAAVVPAEVSLAPHFDVSALPVVDGDLPIGLTAEEARELEALRALSGAATAPFAPAPARASSPTPVKPSTVHEAGASDALLPPPEGRIPAATLAGAPSSELTEDDPDVAAKLQRARLGGKVSRMKARKVACAARPEPAQTGESTTAASKLAATGSATPLSSPAQQHVHVHAAADVGDGADDDGMRI